MTFFSKGIRIRPTTSHGIELRGSLHGFAFFLGELILELLLGGYRLAESSRSTIRCSFSVAFFSRSARPLALFASDYHNTTRSSATLRARTIKQQQHVVEHSPSARC
jgi:hypothetical protein